MLPRNDGATSEPTTHSHVGPIITQLDWALERAEEEQDSITAQFKRNRDVPPSHCAFSETSGGVPKLLPENQKQIRVPQPSYLECGTGLGPTVLL
ncbi:hypothetical protein DAKH74_023310 [Maudiozyma humilis]|uniref:Uncharacterized protein n=1 Tax=Maudiozyma humilis TaxID=51915 RepID=A0AAV5RWB8_MAUHU|nr:hypothetical protein DAKH74_023310 [Kazachstania humilis]